MPANTIYVGRPSRWGNPFGFVKQGGRWVITIHDHPYYHVDTIRKALRQAVPTYNSFPTKQLAVEAAIEAYCFLLHLHPDQHKKAMSMEYVSTMSDLAALHGKHLACWCPPDQPCHADVLLEWAQCA